MKNTATDPAASSNAPSAPAPQQPLLLERNGAVATLRFNPVSYTHLTLPTSDLV